MRHAADSAAHCKPSPPHTRRSHDYPNTVSSSSHRRKFDPAPCLRSAYFKPFSSSHLCRSLAVSAGSREPRRQKPVAPVGVETICLQQDEPRSSDSEPLSAACPGSLGKKHPTVLFIPLFMLFNNSNNETDTWSGALVFSRRCSLVASIYSQFYTSLKYNVDWTGALCEGLLLVWRRLLEFLGTASILCRVKLSGKYCHFQTFLSCALSSCRVCDVIPLEVLESNFNHMSCPFCPTGFSHLKSVTFHFSETLRCKSFSGVSQCDYSHLEVSDL